MENFEKAQRQSLNIIIDEVHKKASRYPDKVMFYIDYKQVHKDQFLKALHQEGAFKLPFAYSRKSKAFYLLTKEYLKENNRRV